MSAEAWAALAAWCTAVVAIVSVIVTTRRTERTNAIALITHLEQEYESVEFRRVRATAARYLHSYNTGGIPDFDEDGSAYPCFEEEQCAIRLLNFFEKVGYLFSQQVVSAEALWHFFDYAIVPYWYASRIYVRSIQACDPNQYIAFDDVFHAVSGLENRRNAGKRGKSWKDAQRIVEFLSEEARTELDPRDFQVV